uniref:EOG090X0C9C n=1 Tax=Evadne anonyx TaxID=141404 RepID=A0A9N6ZFH8_9CRUS|nr:EOG090X0C9C [Evadne anonyx]
MALSCELSQVAYSKIILHAFKYPHTSINGVLLASEGSNNQSIKYVDAIPLFHNNLGLAPMLEVALMQIDSYCRTNGLVIAGYYQANETLGELGPDLVSQKICEKIAEYFANACLVMVNSRQLSKQMTQSAITVIQYCDGKWKVKDKESVKLLPNNDAVLDTISKLLSDKQYKSIVDFDDHLDDISQDWLNVALKQVIEQHST